MVANAKSSGVNKFGGMLRSWSSFCSLSILICLLSVYRNPFDSPFFRAFLAGLPHLLDVRKVWISNRSQYVWSQIFFESWFKENLESFCSTLKLGVSTIFAPLLEDALLGKFTGLTNVCCSREASWTKKELGSFDEEAEVFMVLGDISLAARSLIEVGLIYF